MKQIYVQVSLQVRDKIKSDITGLLRGDPTASYIKRKIWHDTEAMSLIWDQVRLNV